MTIQPPSPPYVGPPAKSSGNGNKPINRIVIHATVSPTKVGGARDIGRYFRSSGAGGSAHYIVDPGEVVQSAYDSVVCWHAPPNAYSLGVELCDPMTGSGDRWGDVAHCKMLALAADLVAQLCLAYSVPIARVHSDGLARGERGITGHVDVSQAFRQSTHWDPGPDFPWKRFLRQVQDAADALTEPATPVPPKEDDMPTTTDLIAALKDELKNTDSALAKNLRNNVRIAVQDELAQERAGQNPGQ